VRGREERRGEGDGEGEEGGKEEEVKRVPATGLAAGAVLPP